MAIAERIQQLVRELPASLQAEVLAFVEYLLARARRQEAETWSEWSLSSAMRGMEDETAPTYTVDDLKVRFV